MFKAFIELATVISAFGTCVAAFLIYMQIRSQRKWDRMLATHEILNAFVSGEIENSLETIKERVGWDILHEKRRYSDVIQQISTAGANEDTAYVDQRLQRLFRRFEAICISMDHKIIREEICREYIFSILTTLYFNCEEFIKIERKRRGEEKVFQFVEVYARKWNTPDKDRVIVSSMQNMREYDRSS